MQLAMAQKSGIMEPQIENEIGIEASPSKIVHKTSENFATFRDISIFFEFIYH